MSLAEDHPARRARRLYRSPVCEAIEALKCFRSVRERIVNGDPLSRIAAFIQAEKRELTELPRLRLVRWLRAYRDRVPAAIVARRLPRAFAPAANRLREGLIELEEI